MLQKHQTTKSKNCKRYISFTNHWNLKMQSKKRVDVDADDHLLDFFRHIQVHQDILVHLFNPANDGKTSHKFETPYGCITMYNATNQKYEISNVKPLPNFAEFKLLMSILCYSQKIKNSKVVFDSPSKLLQTVGYAVNGDNLELLKRTIERYQWFRIHYEDALILDSIPEDDQNITYKINLPANKRSKKTKYCTVNFGILVGVPSNTEHTNAQTIMFDNLFWNFCYGKFGWIRNVNLSVIKQLKSPRQLQIYLYLCKWMNNTGFAKWKPVSISNFINETGLHFDINDRSCYTKLFFEIKQTLSNIYEIDLKCRNQENKQIKSQMWNIKIRDCVYKQSRQLQFVSPTMKFNTTDGTAIDAELMKISEWKELFPELTKRDWLMCKHTKDFFIPIERKKLPPKIYEKIKYKIESKYHEDPYADM